VEDAGVVTLVSLGKELEQPGVDPFLLEQCLEPSVLLDGPVLTNAQK
jgi:hypothetical protein